MEKGNIFLTGASGTIGSAVLEALVASGEFEVYCLARSGKTAAVMERSGGRPVLGDMADPALFELLRNQRDYHFIIHTAQADYRFHSSEEIHALDRAAVSNLERIRSDATKLMIYTSGVWIFGAIPPGSVIDDSTRHNPFEAAQGRSALVSELKVRTQHPWAQLCPPSMVYGAVGPLRVIAQSLENGDIEVLDDETVEWSVIERTDLARAYLALLQHGQIGDFYVVAEDAAVGVIEFYETVASHIGIGRVTRKPRTHWAKDEQAEILKYISASQPVDSTGFKSRTGWKARESFRLSVGRFLLPGKKRT